MNRKRLMQAMLKIVLCSTMLLTSFTAVYADSNDPIELPDNGQQMDTITSSPVEFQPVTADVPVNLTQGATYEYSLGSVLGMNHTVNNTLSPDNEKTKLIDGTKSIEGKIAFADTALFFTNSSMQHSSGQNYDTFVTVDFDLGTEKSVSSISTYSPAYMEEWGGPLGHIGPYSVYVSADNNNWLKVADKDSRNDLSDQTGGYVARYDVTTDGVPGFSEAGSIYTRYVRLVFTSWQPWGNPGYLCVEEVEIMGFDKKMEDAIDPFANAPDSTDPNYPNNIAYHKPYTILNNETNPPAYADPDLTKLTDGVEASNAYDDGKWVGFSSGSNREIVIDLGDLSSVSDVELNLLSNNSLAIMIPGRLDLAFSADGENWASIDYAFLIPETPKENGKVPMNWNSTEDANIDKKEGHTTSKVTARYVKLHVPMAYWTFIDELRILGEKGQTEDAVTLPNDDSASKTYMRKGPHTADIGNMVLLYNGFYDDAAGDWAVEDYAPYLVYEDRKTSEKDVMFDGVLLLALRTAGGKHTFQGPASAAEAATIDDYIWYLDKTLGKQGDVYNLNKAAQLAGEQLGDPDYKLKVVLTIPGVNNKQVDFGALPGTTKSLCFSPDINPDSWQDDQMAALEWYNQQLLERWAAGGFEHLELSGVYLVEEEIHAMTPPITAIAEFAKVNNLKYFWIPYLNAPGFSQWKRWGFDAVAYQPNYTFFSGSGTARLVDAAKSAKAYGMGIELELTGLSKTGMIPPEKFNRYMDYLEVGVEYGFDGDKAFRAYYQDVKALLYASQNDTPKIRYIYDATYQFMKGSYEKGYLQYLNTQNVTLNDVSDIKTVLEAIEELLKTAIEEETAYLIGQKEKLMALQSHVMYVKDEIDKLLATFNGLTADTITESQKVELKITISQIAAYLNAEGLTDMQRMSLKNKLQTLRALDPDAFPVYSIHVDNMTNGKVTSDKMEAEQGDTVNLTVTPNEFYRLVDNSLKVNGRSIMGNQFTMPASNVTITAAFTAISSGDGNNGSYSSYSVPTTSYTITVSDSMSDNGTVSVDKANAVAGSKITITVTPDKGYELDKVTILDSTGNHIPFIDNGNRTYFFIMPMDKVSIMAGFKEIGVITIEPLPFIDVNASDWYFDAVDYVYRNGLFKGTSVSTFSPDTTMTRAMVVSVLYRLNGESAAPESQFTDVLRESWYSSAVDWAADKGIVQGVGKNQFDPLRAINREELVVIIANYVNKLGYNLTSNHEAITFQDNSNISPWAIEAVKAMQQAGIIKGTTDNHFNPKATATRAETAMILKLLNERLVK